jgi:hypothetical protein
MQRAGHSSQTSNYRKRYRDKFLCHIHERLRRHVFFSSKDKELIFMKPQRYYNKVLQEIGSRLAELREKNGYTTLKEFVLTNDLPEVQYWRMEKGKANITLKSLLKVLSIHQLSLHDFFCLISQEQQEQQLG